MEIWESVVRMVSALGVVLAAFALACPATFAQMGGPGGPPSGMNAAISGRFCVAR